MYCLQQASHDLHVHQQNLPSHTHKLLEVEGGTPDYYHNYMSIQLFNLGIDSVDISMLTCSAELHRCKQSPTNYIKMQHCGIIGVVHM